MIWRRPFFVYAKLMLVRHEATSSSSDFAARLQECEKDLNIAHGRCLHHLIVEHGCDNPNAPYIIRMYCACGALSDAVVVFATCSPAHHQNRLLWNYLLRAHGESGVLWDARRVFQQMRIEGILPNIVTCRFIVHILASNAITDEDLNEIQQVHILTLVAGFSSDTMIGTGLLSAYGKYQALEYANKAFNGIGLKDVVAWTKLTVLHVQQGRYEASLGLFKQMQLEGVLPSTITFASVMNMCAYQCAIIEGQRIHSQVELAFPSSACVVWTSMINMYGKCGRHMDATRIFDRVEDKEIVTWNTMIATLILNTELKTALQNFRQMLHEGLLPSKFTYSLVLDACRSLAEGKWIHACIGMLEHGLDLVLESGLVTMYGRCGSLHGAQTSFDEMHKRDVIAWTTH